MTTVPTVLRTLGATGNYKGFHLAVIAVELVLEDETRLCAVTERVYDVTAEKCCCKQYTVERNIRTVIHRIWRINREYLQKISPYALAASPSVSEFIDMIAAYMKHCAETEKEA